MKERIRATALTAGLALFLLAACGAQDAIDEKRPVLGEEPVVDEIEAAVPEDTTADAGDTDEKRPVIEQPLPDEEIGDINVIIKDSSEMTADDGSVVEPAVADDASENKTEKRPVLGQEDNKQEDDKQVVEADTSGTDWFEESKKNVTPNGKFELFTAITKDDFSEDISEQKVECTMDITTVPADREGYNTVVATLMLDCDKGLVWEMVPFDKYTGMAMIIHRLGYGENECEGKVTVHDKTYDIKYTVDIGRGSDGRSSSVYKVTVPKDYDGLMFYVGYANAEIAAKDDTHLKDTMLLSDMPSWGSPSEFFFKP